MSHNSCKHKHIFITWHKAACVLYQKAILQTTYEDPAQALKQNTNPYILHFDIIHSVQYILLLLIKYQKFACTNYVPEIHDLHSTCFGGRTRTSASNT